MQFVFRKMHTPCRGASCRNVKIRKLAYTTYSVDYCSKIRYIEIYEKSLQKIIDSYKEYFVKDETLENGLPKVDDEHMEDYITEINELLAFEVDIDLYYIDEDVFDYEDSDRYDSISAADLIQLRMIICKE